MIRLRCEDPENRALCEALPVQYQMEMPVVAYLDTCIRFRTEQVEDLNGTDFSRRYIFIKGLEWAYEEEWRTITKRTSDHDFEDPPIDPQTIDAVYLGCRMPPEDQDSVIATITSKLPQTEIYRATPSKKTFALEFARIR